MTDAELIRKVAIEVLGWHKDYLYNQEWWFATEAPFRHKRESVNNFNPLTDLNHAFLVVERVTGDGSEWGFQLSREDGIYSAGFFDHEEGEWRLSRHESLGRAICLAALKAVEK